MLRPRAGTPRAVAAPGRLRLRRPVGFASPPRGGFCLLSAVEHCNGARFNRQYATWPITLHSNALTNSSLFGTKCDGFASLLWPPPRKERGRGVSTRVGSGFCRL